jgi:flagellar hook-associated protein 1 FlgK
MDLVGIIMNAGESLGVYRAQVATVSHNIANANTPGYSRQDAVATETVPAEEIGVNGYIGRGVSLQGVVQNRDQFIESQINTAFANSSSTSAQTDALSTVTALDPQGQGGVTDAIGKFYSALRDLNQNPGDLGLRQAVVYSAQDVAKAFNTTVNSISSARSAIDQNVSSLVDKVNGLTASVADLNRRIAQAVNSGRTPNDLLDVRQNDVDQLAQLIGARPVPDDHSSVNLVLPDGTSLVSGIVSSKLTIQANNSNSNHYDVVFSPADGSPTIPLKGSEMGGQIGGLLVSRDSTLGSAETSLDALAFDLTTTVNQQHEQGYALDGTTTNQDLFAMLSAPSAAAKNMSVNPAISANPSLLAAAGSAGTGPGDNTNLVSLIGTESTKLSNGLNVQEGMAKLTSDFGIAVSTVQDSAAFDKNLLSDLSNARESSSGVSVDDELIHLTAAQTAYSALTKVITTTNTMLDTLMKLI